MGNDLMDNESITEEDSYERATKIITDFISENNLEYTDKEEDERLYKQFQDKFSPEVLKNLQDDELLNYIFLHDGDKNNLCYALEYDKDYWRFGSIKGGSAYKYKLFKHQDTGKWMYGAGTKNWELSDEEALEKAREIRDALIKGAESIESNPLENVNDYEKLDMGLNNILKTINMSSIATWIHKYYHMIFPDKFPAWHREETQKDIIKSLKIEPSAKRYGCSGQMALIAKTANISTEFFSGVANDYKNKSNPPTRKIWRIYPTTVEPKEKFDKHWELYKKESIIGVGWLPRVNLNDFETKEEIKEANIKIHNMSQRSTGHNQVWDFVHSINIEDYIIASGSGNEICGIGIVESDYIPPDENWLVDENTIGGVGGDDYFQIRKVKWIKTKRKNLSFDYKNNSRVTLEEINDLKVWNKIKNEYCDDNIDSTDGTLINVADLRKTNLTHIKPDKKLFEAYKNIVWKYHNRNTNENVIRKWFAHDLKNYKYFRCNNIGSSIRDYVVKLFDDYNSAIDDEKISKINLSNALDDENLFNEFMHISLEYCDSNASEKVIEDQFYSDLIRYKFNSSHQIWNCKRKYVVNLFNNYFGYTIPHYSKEDFLNDVVFVEKDYDKLVNLIKRKKNIVLQGSPGVGKTFIAKRLAYSIMGVKDENRIEFVQFHQSYSYEDFIQGYRPSGDGFELNNGVFYNFCRKASEDPENDYYFIIDEINRGNISKIFGELMMLIEDDKRGEDFGIHLTYSIGGPRFYVPENVYIIGMMNTADRSLAIIDYALRRRFVFYLVPPLFDEDNNNDNIFKNHLIEKGVGEDLAIKIIEKFSLLNNLILDDEDLGYGFRIGHSYFCGKGPKTDKWYKSIVNYEIAPLLKEYWFDDLEKAENEIKKLLDI